MKQNSQGSKQYSTEHASSTRNVTLTTTVFDEMAVEIDGGTTFFC